MTLHGAEESAPEVGCVAYMSGVYKIPMVRMSSNPEDRKEMTDEPANVKVYNSTV